MSNSRSRKIRRLMAQTGMNYTKAALELERQEAAEKMNASASKEDVADDSVMSMLARAYESNERPTRPTGLPDADQLREIMQGVTGLPDADQLREAMQGAAAFAIRFIPPA